MLLVAALHIQRQKARATALVLADRLAFEHLVSEISATLIGTSPARVGDEIDGALRRVREVMDLDCCALFILLVGEDRGRITHAADAPRISPPERELSRERNPRFFAELEETRAATPADVMRELSPAVLEEFSGPGSRGAKSLMAIPLTVSDGIVRGMLLQTSGAHRKWPAGLPARLRLIGEILVSADVGKRAEAARQASEERYREVLESQAELICRYLPDTTLTFVNDAYCRFFGRSREDLIGRSFMELIPEAGRSIAREHVASLIANPRVVADEHEVFRPDGSIGWQQWVDHAIQGRDGRVIEFQAVGRDITERKRAEEANRMLSHAGRLALLGELTASIAHEINQPLGAILSNADAAEMLLEQGPEKLDEVRTILADIRREDLRASDVVRHVRSLVHRRQMDPRPLDLREVADDVLPLVEAEARRREVMIGVDFDHSLPVIYGDRVWLQQVLLNLMLNGMEAMSDKAPRERKMTISGRASADGVEVSVADSGHGIPQNLLPSIFDSFVTSRQDGLGLGLAISRSIVEAHGGRIRAENNPGGGATLRVTLPIDANGRGPEAAEGS